MIVLDASFLVKLVLGEEGSGEARSLARSWARSGEVMATVDLALPEALNAVWKHCLGIGDIGRDEAIDIVEDLLRLWRTLRVYPLSKVAREAFVLALEEGITVHDALYLQLARIVGGGLATFDKKLSRIAARYNVPIYP